MGKLSSQRLRRSETVALIRKELRSAPSKAPKPDKPAPAEKAAVGDWFNEGGQ